MTQVIPSTDLKTYFLRVSFGSDAMPAQLHLDQHNIQDLIINQSLDELLPSFRLRFKDVQGIFRHSITPGTALDKITIELGRDTDDNIIKYQFRLYRRFPTSNEFFDLEGLLDIPNLFAPQYTRGFSGTIADTLNFIAKELTAKKTDIDPNLNYQKHVVQPTWSNAQLLTYLTDNVLGSDGSSNSFYTSVQCRDNNTVFCFRSLNSLVGLKHKKSFTTAHSAIYDTKLSEVTYPISNYEIADNYNLYGIKGTKNMPYSYFDIDEGKIKVSSVGVSTVKKNLNPVSLSERYAIDGDIDDNVNTTFQDTGRSNQFANMFIGKAASVYYKQIYGLSKMMLNTWGIQDIYPGDIVKVTMFLNDPDRDVSSYQYQGYWLVEKVVQVCGVSFFTKLFVTRAGYDTSTTSSLLEAKKYGAVKGK